MSKTSNPKARTISVTLTEEEIRALDAVITTAGQANYEWAKNGGGEDAPNACRPCGLQAMSDPKQTELAGADDFNLAGETVTDYQPPPKGDDLTGELPF